MKYYQELAKIPSFTFEEAFKIIGNESYTSKYLNKMVKEGSIHRIRQNLYTCIDFSTGDDYASRFQIGTKINEDSFISYHSAFEFYGFYNQMYFDVQICSSKRFSDFYYNDYHYKYFQTKSLIQVDLILGVKVTTLERTIIDSINMLGKVMDIEELIKCLNLVHRIDENKMLEMLKIYNKEILYRKTGYILSFFKDKLSLSDDFFKKCIKKGIVSNKGYLVPNDKRFLTFDSSWGLYTYGNLEKITYKGGDKDV